MLKLTPGEILRYYRGYQLRQTKEWERVRFLAWYGILPFDTKKSLPSPHSIMRLDIDPDDEQIAQMFKSEEQEALSILQYFKDKGKI